MKDHPLCALHKMEFRLVFGTVFFSFFFMQKRFHKIEIIKMEKKEREREGKRVTLNGEIVKFCVKVICEPMKKTTTLTISCK